MSNIYVLNKDGTPLMPIHSFGRARRMVRSGKARIIRSKPFTLQMNMQIGNPFVDTCIMGIDPGRTNIGICVVDSRGRVLFASDVIGSGLIKPDPNGTCCSVRSGIKPVHEPTGLARWRVSELNRFDFARMENPGIRNWEYQKGKLAGYSSVEEAVSIQQNGKCLLCGNPIQHYHHIVPVSQGGSETIENRVGLCHNCHHRVHTNEGSAKRLRKKKVGVQKKYHALSVINQIMPYLLKELSELLPLNVTTGKETSMIRRTCRVPEKEQDDGTHYIDAWCISVSALDDYDEEPCFRDSFYEIRQFRRHDRARIKAQKERTYYLDGKAVAHNRHKRTGQSDSKKSWDSLAEFRIRHPKDVSRLTVKQSKRSYNNTKRPLPGSEFLADDGSVHTLKATQSGNTKYWGWDNNEHYYSASKCRIIKRNTGLVFV